MAKLQALVIDDEADITGLVAAVLRREGWDVTEAASAEEAFEILPSQNWGAVFSDVILGGDDGFSVLHRCKQEMPATPVVLMTGYATAGEVSVISSRKIVPLSAASQSPGWPSACVNEPLAWPNSSDSINSAGNAPQLTTTNGCARRRLRLQADFARNYSIG